MPDASTTKKWDSVTVGALGAEFVTAGVTHGITHPPGYPLYTLLGHLFTWLPIEPATAVNLMSQDPALNICHPSNAGQLVAAEAVAEWIPML